MIFRRHYYLIAYPLIFFVTLSTLSECRSLPHDQNRRNIRRHSASIRLRPRLRNWPSCTIGPSPVEVNKGQCPPALCNWNTQHKRYLPKNGLQSPFFHGDIVLDDKNEFLRRNGRRQKRATSTRSKLWTKGRVPYVFDTKFSKLAKTAVLQAIKHIQNKTCVRFVKKKDTDKDFVKFISQPGCWSSIGKSGGEQLLCLGEGCEFLGTAVHETVHALGFWHEQSREDRDQYVTIVLENIIPGFDGDFTAIPAVVAPNRGYAYDYASIMHYRKFDFTRNTKDTIRVIGPGLALGIEIGQRDGLSNLDTAQLNDMYRCNVRDDTKQSVCQQGWVKRGRRCYKFVTSPKRQFAGAVKYCARRRGWLLRVESEKEDQFIADLLKKKKIYRKSTWRMAARKVKDNFKWYNPDKGVMFRMKYEHWASGQPGDMTSLAYVWDAETKTFHWHGVWLGLADNKPLYSYSFICEKRARRKCVELKSKGVDYRGDLSHTKKGVTCQSWSSQWPHNHTVKLGQHDVGDHNFCRNPPEFPRSRPWCFTTQMLVEWGYCDVTPCVDEKLTKTKVKLPKVKIDKDDNDKAVDTVTDKNNTENDVYDKIRSHDVTRVKVRHVNTTEATYTRKQTNTSTQKQYVIHEISSITTPTTHAPSLPTKTEAPPTQTTFTFTPRTSKPHKIPKPQTTPKPHVHKTRKPHKKSKPPKKHGHHNHHNHHYHHHHKSDKTHRVY